MEFLKVDFRASYGAHSSKQEPQKKELPPLYRSMAHPSPLLLPPACQNRLLTWKTGVAATGVRGVGFCAERLSRPSGETLGFSTSWGEQFGLEPTAVRRVRDIHTYFRISRNKALTAMERRFFQVAADLTQTLSFAFLEN